MKQIFFCLILLFSFSIGAYAQKNNPVAGHSAKLIDLLKKDYSGLSIDKRTSEIQKDRKQVVSIFRSYLIDDKIATTIAAAPAPSPGATATTVSIHDSLIITRELLRTKTKQLADYKSTVTGAPSSYEDQLQDYSEQLVSAERDYHKKLDELFLLELEELISSFSNENVYLIYELKKFKEKYENLSKEQLDRYAESQYTSAIKKSLPFLGGNVAFETVIDGFSRFLVKRIKEELTTYVIDRMKSTLEEERFAGLEELKIILPRTTAYFMNFNANQLTNFVNELQQYIEDDLNHITESLPNLRNAGRFQRLMGVHPDFELVFEGLEMLPRLKKMESPVDYFELIGNSKTLASWEKDPSNETRFNISQIIELTSLLGNGLTADIKGEKQFVNTDFISSYASERDFYLLYTGFLYQQNAKYHDVKLKANKTEITLTTILAGFMKKSDPASTSIAGINKLKEHRDFFSHQLSQIGEEAEAVYKYAKDIRLQNKRGGNVGADTVHAFINSLADLSEQTLTSSDALLNYILDETNSLPDPTAPAIPGAPAPVVSPAADAISSREAFLGDFDKMNLKAKAQPYFTAVRGINDIVLDFHNEKYALGIIKAIEVPMKFITETEGDQDSLAAIVSSLLAIAKSNELNKWKSYNEFLKNGVFKVNGGKLDNGAKFMLSSLYVELDKVETFLDGKASGDELTDATAEITALRRNLKKLIHGDPIARNELIPTNRSFKKWLLAYYMDLGVNKLVKVIQDKLKEGDDPLSTSDLAFIHELISDYLVAGYDYLVLDEDEDVFTSSKSSLKVFLSQFIITKTSDMNLNPNVIRFIHFINDVGTAKDAEEIENAIENFALPSGSFAIKRDAKFNASLNSFPGIWGGVEFAENSENPAFTTGFTAPVGLSMAWGTNMPKFGTWGFFVPLVDLGAITRFRFDANSNTEALPEFNLKNIFSPGVHLFYGWPKSPLTFNVMLQYGPELKTIDATLPNGFEPTQTYHVGAGLTLDIPLLNIYSRPLEKF